jgi:hypothetical protein
MNWLACRFMKLPGKQKRGGKRRRSASPGDEVEGCDNPAFQASMLEVAVGEGDIDASSVESSPPVPPPRYSNKPPLHRNICV